MTAENDQLTSLVYTSTASAPFRESALAHLLQDSRARNAEQEITGMLLYRDERFIQVLEGPARALRGLAEAIKRDSRHHGMRILLEEPLAARRFTDWSMGYRTLQPGDAPAGFRDSFSDLDADRGDATALRALRELTLWFRVRSGALEPASHG